MADLGTLSNLATVLGVSIHQLWQATRQAAENHSKNQIEGEVASFLDASRRFMAEGHGAAFTSRYYDEGVLQRSGLHRYTMDVNGQLITTALASARPWLGARVPLCTEHEDCKLAAPPTQVPRPTDHEAAAILADIQARNLKVWNAPIFRLLDLSLSKRDLDTQFCLDDFLRYRFTTGALHDELIRALAKTDFNVEDLMTRCAELLPLREKHLPSTPALTDFRSRVTACGINVMTAIARPAPWNDYAIILQQRGKYVSNRQGALTVLPGGHHQPTVEPKVEVAIHRTVMRELFEEVFGGKEAQQDCTRLCVDWYESTSKPMKWFRDHRGAFDLRITGAGISLITGSVSVACALVIKDEGFWRDYAHEIRTNWEVADRLSPVLSTLDPNIDRILVNPQWTDYAFQAIAEGLLFLKEIDKQGRQRVSPKLAIHRPTKRGRIT